MIDEESLRARVLELSPPLQEQTRHLAGVLSQLVDLERLKRGLDDPLGSLTLGINQQKTTSRAPDFVGGGTVAGRYYRACAWVSGDTLKVGLELKRPFHHHGAGK